MHRMRSEGVECIVGVGGAQCKCVHDGKRGIRLGDWLEIEKEKKK